MLLHSKQFLNQSPGQCFALLLVWFAWLTTINNNMTVGAQEDQTTAASASASLDERLVQAALADDPQAIVQALEDGANINYRNVQSGQTVLMTSVLSGKAAAVQTLLQQGADATIPEKDGYGPPHGAGFQGRADVMRILHDNGINVLGATHPDGYLPFHRACWGRQTRHTDTLRYLLELGMNVNAKENNGRTCWEMTSNPATKALLREYGAQGSDEEL